MLSIFFEFPYQEVLFDSKIVLYPIVKVKLNTVFGKRLYSFIMDTGADITTVPRYMIEILGIDRKDLTPSTWFGISKQPVQSLIGSIVLELNRFTFSVPCVFTDNNETPVLLGKGGIFDRFNIFFDNDHNKTVFTERKSRIAAS